MHLIRSLCTGILMSGLTVGAFAAGPPATNNLTSPAKPSSSPKSQTTATQSAPAQVPPPAVQPPGLKLSTYFDELKTDLSLSDSEQKDIETYYMEDGPTLKDVLNDSSISPLQQAQKVSDMRDARNAKIEALLDDPNRQRDFMQIEARYRVALTELAAEGGLVPASALPPVAAATETTPQQADSGSPRDNSMKK
jgi:hypothetical protein